MPIQQRGIRKSQISIFNDPNSLEVGIFVFVIYLIFVIWKLEFFNLLLLSLRHCVRIGLGRDDPVIGLTGRFPV